MEYASVIWNPDYKYQKILIENVQRRATRLLGSLKKQKLSYNERLIKLGLPSLEYRREKSDMLQTFRIVKKIDKTKQDILHIREGSTTRGHSTKLYKKRVKIIVTRNSSLIE